jgi:hypothetical protein
LGRLEVAHRLSKGRLSKGRSMPYNESVHRRLSRIESAELTDVASAITGWTLKRPEFGTAANVSGIRTKNLTFSRRLDSRTIFATDLRYGYLRKAGAWTGSDKTMVSACRRILKSIKVPTREIAGIDALSEMGRVAERLSGDEFRTRDATLLRKLARARRAVDGIAVWSSYATVGLTGDGKLGSLEIHWPELPPAVVKEANLLRSLVSRGIEPPELAGARPESVEAGIIHSPAVGFFMDTVPVVRVIYLGDEIGVGRKPTCYLDRHGDAVEMPRDIRPADPKDVDRPNQG